MRITDLTGSKKFPVCAVTALTFLCGLSAASTPAFASDQSGGNVNLSARVKVQCGLESTTLSVGDDANIARGAVFESCNSNRGFHVLANHRALADDERVRVIYDGATSELSPDGISPIQFRGGARHGAIPVAIQSERLQKQLTVSFALTAI
ncbi:hypothetical protein [Aurantiacibacter aquimixticola]|uniref:hypothetical protein n=1 Tax=Aurantiacibacter aquimixticola TaxID=1958945 RepID=UPI001058D520|nr:hypothetical protein [Aurantiacibacter aquimixticola]